MVFDDLNVLSEPTRARLLRLLDGHELGVGELARILQLPQSTVSRHLKVLLTGEWVARRSVGAASYFHMPVASMTGPPKQLWALVKAEMTQRNVFEEDGERLEMVLARRRPGEVGYFGREAAQWEAVRDELFGRDYLLPLFATLLDPSLRVADLGCGTGELVSQLAGSVTHVVGVDREPAMLKLAEERVGGLKNVRLLEGGLSQLPMNDDTVDLAIAILVLHHVDPLAQAFQEIHRILKPSGRLVIVDMVSHNRTEYGRAMGHLHLGFHENELAEGLAEAGLVLTRYSTLPLAPTVKGPGLFVCSARTWE